jgi:ribosomal protein S18 acetylase RimI-like enzyme
MNIRPINPEEFESARRLLAACGWAQKVNDPELFSQCVQASQIALVIEESGEIAGFLRAITDGIFNGYISMVAVAPDCRGRGFGRALMTAATGINPNITWVLRADRDGVQGFYKSIGFEKSEVAMERRRR